MTRDRDGIPGGTRDVLSRGEGPTDATGWEPVVTCDASAYRAAAEELSRSGEVSLGFGGFGHGASHAGDSVWRPSFALNCSTQGG